MLRVTFTNFFLAFFAWFPSFVFRKCFRCFSVWQVNFYYRAILRVRAWEGYAKFLRDTKRERAKIRAKVKLIKLIKKRSKLTSSLVCSQFKFYFM